MARCKQIGTADSYGNTAIICTDLQQQSYYNSSDQFIGYDVVPRTEAFCENSATTVVPCSNITVANEAAGALSGVGPAFSQACGHSNPDCPAGRYFVVGYTLDGQPDDCVGEVWAVTLAAGTSIQLPSSDKIIDLPANYGTPHATVGSC